MLSINFKGLFFIAHQLMFFSFGICAQSSTDSILYNSDFRFKEGVYLNFESVKRDFPIPKSRIISNIDLDDNDFFIFTTSQDKLFYYDKLGNILETRTKNLWGYSSNGVLYININNDFYRITQVGTISHFVAYKTSYDMNSNYSPYYSVNPYYNTAPTTTTEMRQYLLDFNTGRIFEYNFKSIEVLLMPDIELFEEYQQLSKKKKKQLKFLYIRRYNERNPLYLIKQ